MEHFFTSNTLGQGCFAPNFAFLYTFHCNDVTSNDIIAGDGR